MISELAAFDHAGVWIYATTMGDATGYLDSAGNIWCCGSNMVHSDDGLAYGSLHLIGMAGNFSSMPVAYREWDGGIIAPTGVR